MSNDKYVKICGGTMMYKKNSKVEFNLDRINIFMEDEGNSINKFKKTLYDFIFQKELKNDINTYDGFIKEIINQWKIDMIFTHSVGFLHNQICKLYNNIIKNSNIEVNYSNDKKPGNYTNDSYKLSNLYWFKNDTQIGPGLIQGYCPCEPFVRLKQLIDFPIYDFTDDEFEIDVELYLPNKPANIDMNLSNNLYENIINNVKMLKEWEKYYSDMIEQIEKITFEVMKLNDKY